MDEWIVHASDTILSVFLTLKRRASIELPAPLLL